MTTATEGIFSPIRVGTMSLGHRLVVPPHSGGGGAQELRTRHGAVHLLGDAYAPRRLSFATRQARDLVRAVLT